MAGDLPVFTGRWDAGKFSQDAQPLEHELDVNNPCSEPRSQGYDLGFTREQWADVMTSPERRLGFLPGDFPVFTG